MFETIRVSIIQVEMSGPTNYRKTPQDTARHRKTPQDTHKTPQDTARHLQDTAWKVIIDTQGCGGGGVGGGGEVELSQNFLGEHFYCIFARIVKKQNLENFFFVKIFFCDVTKMFTIFFQVVNARFFATFNTRGRTRLSRYLIRATFNTNKVLQE